MHSFLKYKEESVLWKKFWFRKKSAMMHSLIKRDWVTDDDNSGVEKQQIRKFLRNRKTLNDRHSMHKLKKCISVCNKSRTVFYQGNKISRDVQKFLFKIIAASFCISLCLYTEFSRKIIQYQLVVHFIAKEFIITEFSLK